MSDQIHPDTPSTSRYELLRVLQYDAESNPLPLSKGTVVKFPTSLDGEDGQPGFPLDVIPDLKGFRLIVKEIDGVERFVLRRPNGKELKPMKHARTVQVWIDKKYKCYNVEKLVASSILKKDVTDNEFGILIGEDRFIVESAANRLELNDELEEKCRELPRVDLEIIRRPIGPLIDVTGMGYYVEGGVLFKNGTEMFVDPNGRVMLTGKTGKQQCVRLGLVLATAYPVHYQYAPGKHTEIDHINGNHMINEAWNFRPVTPQQNMALAHQTGDRTERPSPNSSHKKFERDPTKQLTDANTESWKTEGSLERYKNTSYWLHWDGAVLRKMKNGFVYASVLVDRDGYMYVGGVGTVHVMMMKAFDKYKDEPGMKVMHKDDDKQNCALKNLRMGDSKDNAHGKKRVTMIVNGVKDTYDSISHAARETGVAQQAISWNILRERYDTPITSNGITFMLVKNRKRKRYDTPITPSKRVKFMLVDDDEEESEESDESESDESESDESDENLEMGTSSENAHRKKRVTLLCSEEPEDGDQERKRPRHRR